MSFLPFTRETGFRCISTPLKDSIFIKWVFNLASNQSLVVLGIFFVYIGLSRILWKNIQTSSRLQPKTHPRSTNTWCSKTTKLSPSRGCFLVSLRHQWMLRIIRSREVTTWIPTPNNYPPYSLKSIRCTRRTNYSNNWSNFYCVCVWLGYSSLGR